MAVLQVYKMGNSDKQLNVKIQKLIILESFCGICGWRSIKAALTRETGPHSINFKSIQKCCASALKEAFFWS